MGTNTGLSKIDHMEAILKTIDEEIQSQWYMYRGLLSFLEAPSKEFQEAYKNKKLLEVQLSKAQSDLEIITKQLESIRVELKKCDDKRDDLSREKQDFESAKKSKTKTREELHQMKELLNSRIIDYNKILKEWQGKEKEVYAQYEAAKKECDRIKEEYDKANEALTKARESKLDGIEPLFHQQRTALALIGDIDCMVSELNKRKEDLMKLLSDIVSSATREPEGDIVPSATREPEGIPQPREQIVQEGKETKLPPPHFSASDLSGVNSVVPPSGTSDSQQGKK